MKQFYLRTAQHKIESRVYWNSRFSGQHDEVIRSDGDENYSYIVLGRRNSMQEFKTTTFNNKQILKLRALRARYVRT